MFDVCVVGGGPAGSLCALHAARAGLKVALVDKANFPRPKVCGDCVNPRVLPLLEEAGIFRDRFTPPSQRAQSLAFASHEKLLWHRNLADDRLVSGPWVVQRKFLDAALVEAAGEAGAHFFPGEAVRSLEGHWLIATTARRLRADFLVVADGRNSFCSRLLKISSPPLSSGRSAIQWHGPCPAIARGGIRMFFLRNGYGGVADCGNGQANFCFVDLPARRKELEAELVASFGLPPVGVSSLAPISRSPVKVVAGKSFVVLGDAARVVEPFTGEGIALAMDTGRLAGRLLATKDFDEIPSQFSRLRRNLYQSMGPANFLSKWAGKNPSVTASLLANFPGAKILCHWLSNQVLHSGGENFTPGAKEGI
jgi:flavin-dependent dehydrogenase